MAWRSTGARRGLGADRELVDSKHLGEIVGTMVVCSTCTVFTGLRGANERHFVVTTVATDGSLLLSLLAPSLPL